MVNIFEIIYLPVFVWVFNQTRIHLGFEWHRGIKWFTSLMAHPKYSHSQSPTNGHIPKNTKFAPNSPNPTQKTRIKYQSERRAVSSTFTVFVAVLPVGHWAEIVDDWLFNAHERLC